MVSLEIYKASAGSGKTYTLTRKYLSYLFSADTNHRNILAVTFTNKATEEMKVRILKELYFISIESEKSEHIDFFCKKLNITPEVLSKKAQEILKNLLNEYSAFQISTIDKFFLKIIQSFTHEMSLNGNYNLELDTDTLLEKAIENMLNNLEIPENKQLLFWLKKYAEELINNEKSWNPVSSISELGRELFKESFKNELSNSDWYNTINDKTRLKAIQTKIKEIKNIFEGEIDDLVCNIRQTLKNNGLEVADFPYANASFMANAINIKNKKYEIGKRLKDAMDATDPDSKEWCSKSAKDSVRQNIASAFADLKKYLEHIEAYIKTNISKYKTACEINKNIYTIGILSDVEREVNNIVKEKHLLLLSNANDFLSKIIAKSDTPFIYEKIGTRIKHFMIDEFQDTSGLQWSNFRPLLLESLGSGNENMLVGDVKQSIYRWRNSDWDLLNTQLEENDENKIIKEYICNNELDTNFRSSKNVILFNNTFFTLAAQKIKEEFQKIEGSDNPIFVKKIEKAYSNLLQRIGKKNISEGYVNVQFIEKNDDTSWKDIALQKMTGKVRSLLEKGKTLSDIAVLVRTNDEASCVAEHLLQNGYNVLSNEALKLKNAKSVQFIIALLTYFVHPDDFPNRLFLLYRYFLLIEKSEQPLQNAVSNINEDIKTILFQDKSKDFEVLEKSSLFEQTEALIYYFSLVEKCKTEVAFLQAFQDVVFEYENKNASDLSNFLKYWDENKKLNLNVPKSSNAIQILTIHASKGLEFKNVIIPFFDWNLEPKTNNRVWCGTKHVQDYPFNELPIVPMSYNTAMSESFFKNDYLKEKMLGYIDTLNVAYVAFTRACEGLCVFAPKPKEKREQANNKLPDILFDVLQTSDKPDVSFQKDLFISMQKDMIKCDDELFVIGEVSALNKKESKQCDKNQIALTYVSKEPKKTLVVSKENKWIVEKNSRSIGINYGLMMHNLMSKINTLEDIDVSVKMFENEGQITKEEACNIKEKIIGFIEKNNISYWFSNNYKILNEVEIRRDGKTFRSDRVLIKDNHAIVIDYKFGEKTPEENKEQVRKYKEAIQAMGYTTEGYLCYIEQGFIEQV